MNNNEYVEATGTNNGDQVELKRLTADDFKQICNDSGLDFTIFGYEGILNALSMFYGWSAKKQRENGRESLANYYDDVSDGIYDELKKRGYYDV